jgi:hypothetical protein
MIQYLKLGAYAVGAIAIGFAVYKVDQNGYQRAEARYLAKEAKEIARLQEANEVFRKEADKIITMLTERNLVLEKSLQDLMNEAHKDPTATNVCLPARSVQRLNTIR